MTSRDWAQEQWRRQYLGEPAGERLWPVMARATRELLHGTCDDQGRLFRVGPDALGDVVKLLRPCSEERALLVEAVQLLFAQDYLASEAGFVCARGFRQSRGAREPWRKRYLREPLQQLTWPTLARGIRDLLNRFAEDDGSVMTGEGWVQNLACALGAHEPELELVQEALRLLEREGFLVFSGARVSIPDLPPSQACGGPRTKSGPGTSTERVRRHRARKRALAALRALGDDAPQPSLDIRVGTE